MAEPSSAHGFGYPPPTAAAAGAAGISIVAPAHDDAFMAGKFPEPSPAACGKRKLAEIAAAQEDVTTKAYPGKLVLIPPRD